MILHVQLILLIWQLIVWTQAPDGFNCSVILQSIILSAIAFVLYFHSRQKSLLKNHSATTIITFLLLLFFLHYQLPIEILMGNEKLDLNYFLYDTPSSSRMFVFSFAMVNTFLFGLCLGLKAPLKSKPKSHKKSIPTRPLYYVLITFFLFFLLTINLDYINNGHGTVAANPIALSFYGLFIKTVIIYISITTYNNIKSFKTERWIKSIIKYIKLFPFTFWIILIIATTIFLLANNRVYVIFLLGVPFFSFFLVSKKQIGLVKFSFTILLLSTFAMLFKILGIANLFSLSTTHKENYTQFLYYFPITAELSGSSYSGSILYYLYEQELFLYGKSFIVGLIRIVPGFMNLLGEYIVGYDSGIIATKLSGKPYGVGTTAIHDLLINFGAIPSIIIFGIIGYMLSKNEIKSYSANPSVVSITIYCTVASLIIFLPRSSLNDLIGFAGFSVIFLAVYVSIVSKIKQK